MTPHLAIVRREPPSLGFQPVYRDAAGAWGEPGSGAVRSLDVLVTEGLDWMTRNPHGDFTLSTIRTAKDIEHASLIGLMDDPTTLLSGVLDDILHASLTVLLPTGRPDRRELWADLGWYRQGGLFSSGRECTFVVATLHDRIGAWCKEIDGRAIENGKDRTTCRELWVRGGWRAADLLPDDRAFQTPPAHPRRTPDQEGLRQAFAAEQRIIEQRERVRKNEEEVNAAVRRSEEEWAKQRGKGR